jgi:hypothetical protein
MSQPRRLWKQSSVRQRDGEIRVGFPLDNYSAVNQVIADRKAGHPHVEDATLSSELEQGRISLGIVHIESVTLTVHNGGPSGLRRRRWQQDRLLSSKQSRAAVAGLLASVPAPIRLDPLRAFRWGQGQREVEDRDALSAATAAADRDDLVSLGQIDPFDPCGHAENVHVKGKRQVPPSA